MNQHPYSRIAIKVGSNVLTRADGTLDVTQMSALVDQMAELHRDGIQIILISSGAVASGRSEVNPPRKLDSVERRQLFSAVGQAKLINRYYELFREHRIVVGQVLTMKENFATRRHYLNQRSCMNVMLEGKVIPIVNENDTVAVSELMFTDNDELSGLIATMMDVQQLIILSNIDGIYNGNPELPETTLIKEVYPGDSLDAYIQTGKSSFGRGGMLTKTSVARKVADEGIGVTIANGRRQHILTDLIRQPLQTPCTRFVPATTPLSGVKKWIAHSRDFAKGELMLNAEAADILRSDKAVSILPVGITLVKGEFEKDDIVKILSPEGDTIAVGKTNCNSTQAREALGKHGRKPVVHYDYLCFEIG
ncbi:MAG: glutamate 5-kinase [Mediterranea sp.]|jgi:glutamate 5-kinase|nr:glutamate 5-kinase [Mediterranea sp.]